MTGSLKNRTLHCQAKKALVRRGRWLLGNFTQFSIIEKLGVPGAFKWVLRNPVGSSVVQGLRGKCLGQDRY